MGNKKTAKQRSRESLILSIIALAFTVAVLIAKSTGTI